MPTRTKNKNMIFAALMLKNQRYDVALRMFTHLSEDMALKENIYFYSSILFDLGVCHFASAQYDLAYVNFMKANTVWPTAAWAPFAASNAATCIEALEGPELALEKFCKNIKAHANTDNLLSIAYHAYHLKTVRKKELDKELKRTKSMIETIPSREIELTKAAHETAITVALKTSLAYLNRAFRLNSNDTIVLKLIVNLYQEMDKRGIIGWTRNDDVLFNLADYFKKEKRPHKAREIYHNWFEAIEKKRLAEGKEVSMLCLLELEAECYDKMGQPQLAIEVLRRQAGLFRRRDNSRFEAIQNKQYALNAAIPAKVRAALKSMDNEKQHVSQTVRDNIQAYLAQLKSHPNIRPSTGGLHFFATKTSDTNESENPHNPIRPNKSCVF